jgi:hypothetical protein
MKHDVGPSKKTKKQKKAGYWLVMVGPTWEFQVWRPKGSIIIFYFYFLFFNFFFQEQAGAVAPAGPNASPPLSAATGFATKPIINI